MPEPLYFGDNMENITNITLHGSIIYNNTNMAALANGNLSKEEILKRIMGPKKQEDEVRFFNV